MKKLYIGLAILLVVSLVAAFSCAPAPAPPTEPAAPAIKPMMIKLSHALPAEDMRAIMANKFKELMEKKSDGQVKVAIYPAGQLFSQKDEIEGAAAGAVEILSWCPYTAKRFDTAFTLGLIPNLFPTWDNWYKFWEDPNGGGYISELSEKIGLYVGREWIDTAGIIIYVTKKPVRKIEDFKGMKLRCPLAIEGGAKGVGASAVPISTLEVFTALQTGMVDGIAFTNLMIVKGFGWYSVARYATDFPITWGGFGTLACSKSWWDGLSPEMRSLVEASVKEAAAYTRSLLATTAAETKAWLMTDKGFGKGFYDMAKEDPAENKKFRDVIRQAMINQYVGTWPGSFVAAIEKHSGSKLR